MARPLSPDDPILSGVVSGRNDEANIFSLVAEIETALKGSVYEFVYVDDDSTDGTSVRLRETGTDTARLDQASVSCGRDDPADIPALPGHGP